MICCISRRSESGSGCGRSGRSRLFSGFFFCGQGFAYLDPVAELMCFSLPGKVEGFRGLSHGWSHLGRGNA